MSTRPCYTTISGTTRPSPGSGERKQEGGTVLEKQAQKASAGVIQSYALQIQQETAADLGAEYRQAHVRPTARERTYLDVRSRLWYNAPLEYDDYMAPGILTILVTLIGTLLTAQNITREKEMGTIEQLNVTPITKGQFVAGKLLPFWGLGLVEFAVGLVVAWLVFGIPTRGSLLLLFGVTGVYLVVALGTGLWISTVADTQQQAMFVTFFVMVMYLFMSGLFTPVASMPTWAEWLAELSPLKHFIEIMRTVLLNGSRPSGHLAAHRHPRRLRRGDLHGGRVAVFEDERIAVGRLQLECLPLRSSLSGRTRSEIRRTSICLSLLWIRPLPPTRMPSPTR